ncbi:penicillin-binding protein activator LpoB [Pseudaeromonas paramecii]|uniref:Penicillin-binding protein activator LpoB n=1 Tax=Pseudaeromonas paramecii TaxID=2138166 RepID=A0ABP8QFR5_9GAMM
MGLSWGRSLLSGLLALGLAACVTPYGAGPAQVGTAQGQGKGGGTSDGAVSGHTDVRLTRAAQSLMAGLLKDADVRQQTAAGPVSLYLHPVTLKQGDAQALNAQLVRSLTQSGRFTLVAGSSSLGGELEYHQAGGATPAALVRLGKRTGARWMLYGGLDAQGRLAMQLMDLKSGEWLWSGYRSPR